MSKKKSSIKDVDKVKKPDKNVDKDIDKVKKPDKDVDKKPEDKNTKNDEE